MHRHIGILFIFLFLSVSPIYASEKEGLSVHIGQTGCKVGNACWELFCLEHCINPHNGTMADEK
ncbi:MAG TPA: hypothetical protein QGF02_03180 [Candidatus Babeliales bacterium]|nr:hypothetical protein [Candidatus Babeliales bacterium]